MPRAYNVVDADGHILEPLDLWDRYIDPNFRDRAPRIVKGESGKERLVIEEHTVGTAQRRHRQYRCGRRWRACDPLRSKAVGSPNRSMSTRSWAFIAARMSVLRLATS